MADAEFERNFRKVFEQIRGGRTRVLTWTCNRATSNSAGRRCRHCDVSSRRSGPDFSTAEQSFSRKLAEDWKIIHSARVRSLDPDTVIRSRSS